MSIERMADRTLPLAQRVTAAYLVGIQVAYGDENGQDARAALDSLRADIAAADRLARAALVVADYKGMRMELTRRVDIGDTTTLVYDANAWYQTGEDYKSALAAYRARMAQGVGDA